MFDNEKRKIVWLTGKVYGIMDFYLAKETNWKKRFNYEMSKKIVVVIWIPDISNYL